MTKELSKPWYFGLLRVSVINNINIAQPMEFTGVRTIDPPYYETREFRACEYAVICAVNSCGRVGLSELLVKRFIASAIKDGALVNESVCLEWLPVVVREMGITLKEKS